VDWYGSPQPSDFTGVDITSAESGRAPGSRQGMWQHRKAGLGVIGGGVIGGVLGLVSGSAARHQAAIGCAMSLVVGHPHSGSSGAILGGLFRALLAR